MSEKKDSPSVFQRIEELVRQERLVSPTASTRDLIRSLRLWWCMKYGKPFKDPLLLSYTLEELFYEYMTHYFMNADHDPLRQKGMETSVHEDMEWARQQLEAMKTPTQSATPPPNPPLMGENIGELPPDLPEFNTRFDE